jgi:hypothetical protein
MTQPNPFQIRIGETRRRGVERVDDMSAKDTTVTGFSAIDGVGEALVEVLFPVAFGQKPVFAFGGELDETTPTVVLGQFPSYSGVVVSWTVVNKITGAFSGYYTGCTIAVVVGGLPSQKSWLHWSFRAPAIRNPVRIVEDLGGTL